MATAILNGTLLDDGGFPCECAFEYGLTVAYGLQTPWRNGFRTGDTFSERVINLLPGTTYHFRAMARNAVGTTYGADRTFTTVARAPAVVTDPANNITGHSAGINETLIVDSGEYCDMKFEYGATTAYGMETAWLGGFQAGDSSHENLVDLASGVAYHCRAVARNKYGVVYGLDVTFSTLAEAPQMTGLQPALAMLLEEV